MIKDYQIYGVLYSYIGHQISLEELPQPMCKISQDHYGHPKVDVCWAFYHIVGEFSPYGNYIDFYRLAWLGNNWGYFEGKQIRHDREVDPQWHVGTKIKGFQFWRGLRDQIRTVNNPLPGGLNIEVQKPFDPKHIKALGKIF